LDRISLHTERVLTSEWFLPGVLLLAACLRLGHVWALRSTPWLENLQLDHRIYDQWAQRIAAGDWIGDEVFFLDPLYPYFLALLYKVFTRDLLLVRLVQVAFGVGTCYLTAILGRRIGGTVVGNLACLFAALFAPAVYYESMLEKTSLSVFLITLALVLFLGRSRLEHLLAGTFLGLAALTRANFLVLVPLGLLVLLVQRPAAGESASQPAEGKGATPVGGILSGLRQWRTFAFRSAAAFLGGALLVLVPVTLRNHHVGGEWVLTTANAGQNFYIGNNAENAGGSYKAPDFVRPDPRYEQDDWRREAEARVGRSLSPREISDFWFGEAWKEIRGDPGFALKMLGRKSRLFWNDYEVPDNNNIRLVADYSWVLRLPLIGLGWMVPLAAVAAVVAVRKRRGVGILVAFAVLYCLTVVTFFVFSRFRVQLSPVLFVLTAYGALWLWLRVREARWKQAALAGVLAVVLGLFCLRIPEWEDPQSDLAVTYNNLGSLYLSLGRTQEAIEAYERAVEIKPGSVVGAMRTLGDVYSKLGDYEEAEKYLRQVVSFKPGSRRGWGALSRLYQKLSTSAPYRDDPEVFHKLARASLNSGSITRARQAAASAEAMGRPLPSELLERLEGAKGAPSAAAPGPDAEQARVHYELSKTMRREGRWSEAIEHLKKAIALGPYDEAARYTLGRLMIEHGRPDETIAYYREALASDPKPQTSYYFWGRALAERGSIDQAIDKFRQALDVDPAHEMSQNQWGLVLEKQGRIEEAVTHYQKAISIHPDFTEAHQNLARALRELSRDAEADRHLELARHSDPNTTKRYLYWGRALVREGRYQAAIPELQKALRVDPEDREAQSLLATARGNLSSEGLTHEQRSAMLESLAASATGSPIWFSTDTRDPGATALQREIEDVFLQAGWQVRGNEPVRFRLKPGIFVFMADPAPPRYAIEAREALEAAGLPLAGGTAYRDYYQRMKRKDPSWRGIEMTPEQTFVVVIGRQP
jgi:tetratricopeptide (TPR) repeat protein